MIYKKFIIIFAILLVNLNISQYSCASPKNVFTNRYAEIVIDANNGRIMFAANENAKRYPASLTKLMTLYLLFDAIKAGRVSLNTPIPVSHYAASMPPTKIGFTEGQTINAEQAAKAMITKSANDVAAAIGEYLGGTEQNFAKMMTLQAHKLGMMNTHFNNASGLPDINNYTTARDLATLCLSLRRHFPQLYYLFKTTSFKYNGRTINGHNHILKNMPGVDGLKTGYTQMSGFNLATSYYAHNKNIVAVIMGWRSASLRDARMTSLVQKFTSNRTQLTPTIPLPIFKDSAFKIFNPVQTSIYQITTHNTHTIQIGYGKTKTEAEKLYKKLYLKNKTLFKHTQKQIIKFHKQKQTIYRIRLTHINSKASASHICSLLQHQKYSCFVVN